MIAWVLVALALVWSAWVAVVLWAACVVAKRWDIDHYGPDA